MKKTIILTAGDINNGLSYQRGHLFMRYLRDKYDFVCVDFEKLSHTDLLYADGIVFFHPYHAAQLQLIHRAKTQYGKIKVFVDIDDLITNMPSDHPEFYTFKGNSVYDIAKLTDQLIVSTDYLKLHFGHLNKNIMVIENQIDTGRYTSFVKQPKPYHAGFVIGWTGSYSHRPDLYNTGFIKGLTRFMKDNDDVRAYFHILCPQTLLDEFGARIIYNEKPVDFLDYPSMCFTYPFDVCAVPLYDHPFNHAKSDLRLLDMSVFKIPIIASNVTPFEPHHKRAILTNNTGHDWYHSFKWCRDNPKLFNKTIDDAHEYVMNERKAELSAAKWETVFKIHLNEV